MTYADDMQDAADQVGITTDQIQTLNNVAQYSGAKIEDMSKALTKVNDMLGQVVSNGPQAADALQTLGKYGIDREWIATNGSNAATVLEHIAQVTAGASTEVERFTALSETLGDKLTTKLMPAMAEIATKGLGGLKAEYQALGLIMDETLLQKLDELNKRKEQLEQYAKLQGGGAVASGMDNAAYNLSMVWDRIRHPIDHSKMLRAIQGEDFGEEENKRLRQRYMRFDALPFAKVEARVKEQEAKGSAIPEADRIKQGLEKELYNLRKEAYESSLSYEELLTRAVKDRAFIESDIARMEKDKGKNAIPILEQKIALENKNQEISKYEIEKDKEDTKAQEAQEKRNADKRKMGKELADIRAGKGISIGLESNNVNEWQKQGLGYGTMLGQDRELARLVSIAEKEKEYLSKIAENTETTSGRYS
jgi:hypothetical protein